MSTCINSGWAKLDKYYALTSKTPAYVGALVLHPAYKWQYIEEHWLREWWGPAKAALQGLWEEKYAPIGVDRLPACEGMKRLEIRDLIPVSRRRPLTAPRRHSPDGAPRRPVGVTIKNYRR